MTTTLELWLENERTSIEATLADLERRIIAGKDDQGVIQELNWEADRLTTYLKDLEERPECFYSGHEKEKGLHNGQIITWCKRCGYIVGIGA